MKIMRLRFLFCFMSLFCFSTAYAFDRENAATLTLGGGYDYFSPKRHIENAGYGFGILGFDFTKHWGIEGFLGYLQTNSHKAVDEGRQVRGTLFAIDAVYHFSPIRFFEPFVLAGPGIVGLNPNGYDANNQGNVNAGVGALMYISRSIAFRAEARDFYTINGGINDILVDGGVTFLMDT